MEIAEQGFERERTAGSELTVQDAKDVAETVGTLTRESLERSLHLSKTVAERIHYGHTWSLMLLESALTMGMARVEGMSFENMSLAGSSLLVLTATKAGAELYQRVKGEQVLIGKYGVMHVEPYRAVRSRPLSDGTTMTPGDKVGIIDFARGIPFKNEHESIFSYTKNLIRTADVSFIELAEMCETDDPRLSDVNFFGGRSHLAGPIAKRMGFDVFDVANPLHRYFEARRGKDRVKKQVSFEKGSNPNNPEGREVDQKGEEPQKAEENSKTESESKKEMVVDQKWKEMEKNFKDPRDAYISRQKIIELYGSQSGKLQLLNARRSSDTVGAVGEAHEDDSLSVAVKSRDSVQVELDDLPSL
jgi:hypothetical protein